MKEKQKPKYTESTYFLFVDGITINSNIIEECFVCDLEKCKGACCTIENAYGAPITPTEIEIILKNLPIIKKYLDKKNIDVIDKIGIFERIYEGYNTTTIDGKDCVFVYWENGIAKCAIEKAYLNNEIDFKKPISCHLFPIKVNKFANDVLRGEFLKICEPAIDKGLESGVPVYEFCKESLIRLYGKNWYSKLLKEIKKVK